MTSLILIVAGNPEDRQIIRDYLFEAATAKGLRFRFCECGDGEAGLAACHSAIPDCILLDHQLPDMDGVEFLARLKGGAQGIPVPVVLLTDSADMSGLTDALRAGAQEYLHKRSCGPEVLFRAVQSAQDRFRLFGHHEVSEVWKALASSRAETRVGKTNLLASEAALASSQAETRVGKTNLLASEAALASSQAETQAGLNDLLASAVALTSSQTETRNGLARLLASAAALAASRAETQDGLTDLVASAAALSASRAETQDGLADLVASAAALSVSRTETQDGRAELLASAVVNKALSLANALLITSDAAVRASEAQLRGALVIRQTELERLVAERSKALVEAEARFRGIFDSQLQFISLLDPDGIIIEMNRTSLEAAKLARADVIGRPFWHTEWWSPDQRLVVQQDIAMAAAGGVIRREIEISFIRNQERGIWIDLSFKPVRDPETHAVTSIVAESHDLTEKRGVAAQLAQAQKVQALGQLAAGIAHDFNNILQVVSGAVALIEQRPGDLERTRRLARSAITAADRGMSITQRLLSFARRGELRAEAVETTDLIHSLCDVLTHTLGSTITVRADIRPDVPPLIADRAQLETAMINLGVNSRDAMPNGGLLIISAEAEHVREGLQHSADLGAGDYIRLTVSDNGTGMDAATLARVSEPFFTTKPLGQGTGLGVAMAKGFAEQSGGGLSITSALGAGTAVSIWLRQASEIVLRAPELGNRARKPTSSSVCVLIVDDDDQVREVLAAQLEDEGFNTLVAGSGKEALVLIEADDRIDVLVCDLSMPSMDGVTTIRQARAMRSALPCFLLTGYVGDGAALSAGNAFVLVRKPITGKVLAAQIEAALENAG